MLVLSRRTGEQIVIGGNIRLTVLEIRGARVRLGIEAPPEAGGRKGKRPQRHGEHGGKNGMGKGAHQDMRRGRLSGPKARRAADCESRVALVKLHPRRCAGASAPARRRFSAETA